MTDTIETTTLVGVVAAELARALANVALCTGKSGEHEEIQAVRLTWDADGVHLWATNRYIMIKESLPFEGDTAPGTMGECFITSPDLALIVKALRGVRALTRLELTEDLLAVDTLGQVIAFRTKQISAPRLYEALDEKPWPEAHRDFSRFAISPNWLAILGKLKPAEGDHTALTLGLGTSPNKPLTFTLGSRITGVVMPVKISA